MSLKDLQEKRAKLVADARSALDEITKNTDEARAAELDKRHDDIMAEFDKIEKVIEREERTAKAEKREEETRARRRPAPGDSRARGQDDGDPIEYRAVFHKLLASGGDPTLLAPEERAVLIAGAVKKGEAEFRAQVTTSGGPGGYTVPVELANIMIKSMAAWGPMYDEDICTTINTAAGNQINLPTVDDTAVPVVKHTEGTALTDDGGSDVTFAQKRLDAYMFDTEFIRFSLELAQDSIFNVEALLGDLLGERLGRRANLELTVGDGSGDPNGVVTASSLGKTAASATAVTTDELIDLVHSVNPAYRTSPKVRFMFNDTTLAAIRKLKNGTGDYLWDAGDFTNGIPGTLLGYRYSINQAMPAMTTGLKPIIFGDFGKYFVRKVGSPIIGVLRERFWPDLGIAGLIRLDGELGDTAAIKHLIQA